MVTWQLTVDSCDPARLVAFWAPVLGYVVTPPPAGFTTWNDWYRSVGVPDEDLDPVGDGADRIADPDGNGPPIWFQRVPEPKASKNRLHLDLYPARHLDAPRAERIAVVEARVAELVAAGASVLHRHPDDVESAHDTEGYFVVMHDPEGNEFCVSAQGGG